ncbi:ATPase, T2SS/T4P/T4SS family [Phycisphaeraceae bacterium D3-23]
MGNESPTNRKPVTAPPRVGDLLLERGLITQQQIDQALDYQRASGKKALLGEVLVELEFVTEAQVMEAIAQSYGVPFASITPSLIDPKTLEILDRAFCEKHLIVPLFLIEGRLTVAVSEPANVFITEEVERMTGHPVQVVASTPADIRQALAGLQSADSDAVFVIDDMMDDFEASDLDIVEQEITDLSDLEDSAGESPVIKLVNYIIFSAVKEGASDIHVEPDDGRLRIRFRVDGRLFEKLTPPHHMLAAMVSRIKIMSALDISERRIPQDGAITIRIDKRQIDLRVSTMPGKFGEKVVMRIVDQKNAVTSLDYLGFHPDMLRQLRELIAMPNGVVLVTGPTGSGKSTTLYGALAEINREDINISTVEDPVEYNLPGVNQFQTHDKAGFTFAKALRALLRQDPDVVMLGEIRDPETAKTATQAALTGHLVLSTLHTNDAPSAITRLINVGVESYLVAAALRGILAQRLVRKLCQHCREAVKPDKAEQQLIAKLENEGHEIGHLYRGAGCNKCRNTGFAGRLGIYELLVPNDEALDAIARGDSPNVVRDLSLKTGGYRSLKQDGVAKAAQGLTTLEEVFKATAM